MASRRTMGIAAGAVVAASLASMVAAGPALASGGGSAITLGITAQPGESGSATCSGAGEGGFITELSAAASTPFTVPTGGGLIVEWQTDTAGAEPGAPVMLLVLRPVGPNYGEEYEVVGTDSEELPSPLPSGGRCVVCAGRTDRGL